MTLRDISSPTFPAPQLRRAVQSLAPAPSDPDVRGKDQGIAIILTMFLGPIGLCYIDPRGGLMLFALAVLLAIPTLMIGPVVISLYCVIKAWRAFGPTTTDPIMPGVDPGLD